MIAAPDPVAEGDFDLPPMTHFFEDIDRAGSFRSVSATSFSSAY